MAISKKALVRGTLLSVVFWAVLIIMFMPVFGGKNAFEASDQLFNTISKGSTHYIPKLTEQAEPYNGQTASLDLALEDGSVAKDAQSLLSKAGLQADLSGKSVSLNADLGTLFKAVLQDSDDMFYNRGEKVKERYGLEERRALFVWWHVMKAAVADFNKKGGKDNFATAKYVEELTARGVEVAYNFYGIKPESVSSKAIILIAALIFYVVYTLWWGFAIYFLAEGAGLKLEGGGHKEET